MYTAVKVRLDPTPRQERALVSHAGAARFAWNAGLAHVKEQLEQRQLEHLAQSPHLQSTQPISDSSSAAVTPSNNGAITVLANPSASDVGASTSNSASSAATTPNPSASTESVSAYTAPDIGASTDSAFSVATTPSDVIPAAPGAAAVDWTFYSLRKWWNGAKDQLAPWWAINSKEAYSYGLQCLGAALKAFQDSRHGRRRGEAVGFPRFKSKGECTPRFAYTTGAGLIDGDPRALRLPKIGRVHCMEDVARRVDGRRVVRVTLSQTAGVWYASLTLAQSDGVQSDGAQNDAQNKSAQNVGVQGDRVQNKSMSDSAARGDGKDSDGIFKTVGPTRNVTVSGVSARSVPVSDVPVSKVADSKVSGKSDSAQSVTQNKSSQSDSKSRETPQSNPPLPSLSPIPLPSQSPLPASSSLPSSSSLPAPSPIPLPSSSPLPSPRAVKSAERRVRKAQNDLKRKRRGSRRRARAKLRVQKAWVRLTNVRNELSRQALAADSGHNGAESQISGKNVRNARTMAKTKPSPCDVSKAPASEAQKVPVHPSSADGSAQGRTQGFTRLSSADSSVQGRSEVSAKGGADSSA